MEVIVIVGLPGSGKTHLALKLSDQTGFPVIDDPTSRLEIIPYLDGKKSFILVDQSLTFPGNREGFLNLLGKVHTRWIFFENDREACRRNVKNRDDGRLIGLSSLEGAAALYNWEPLPENVEIMDVWNSARCPTCSILIPEGRAELGYQTCIKHSDEKTKDHQPGVVNSLGLHEKYFPEGR